MHPPQRPQRRRARDGELDHPDPPAGADHARELSQRRQPVVDVAQQVGEREAVELCIGERKPLGLAAHEAHALVQLGRGGEARPRSREHLLALIEPDDAASSTPREREGHHPGAGSNVDDALPRLRIHRGDHRPPPPGILAKAQRGTHAVVMAWESGEQLKRVALARGQRGFRRHGHLVPQA